MSRKDLIVKILTKYPGLSAYDIEQRLIAGYRFKWFGQICEFGQVYIALGQLAQEHIITSRSIPGPHPRKRIYFVEPV